LVDLSVRFSNFPIVLNESSYSNALLINPNTQQIPAFIVPQSFQPIAGSILSDIHNLKSAYKYLFCTNAYSNSIDSGGQEIYQVTQIVDVFNSIGDLGLIVSDPSGNYKRFFEEKKIPIGQNTFFISEPHDFNLVLKEADCFIRFTTTDGDSLSVKEALFWGKDVIASNVVSRPNGVILVDLNRDSLKHQVSNYTSKGSKSKSFIEDGGLMLIELYKRTEKNKTDCTKS
jgi:hypothetical protein